MSVTTRSGVSEEVARLAGIRRAGTMDMYSHVVPEQQRDAATWITT